jgi:hypothetical protein
MIWYYINDIISSNVWRSVWLTYNNTRIKTKLFYINCVRAKIQHSVKTEKVLKTQQQHWAKLYSAENFNIFSVSGQSQVGG